MRDWKLIRGDTNVSPRSRESWSWRQVKERRVLHKGDKRHWLITDRNKCHRLPPWASQQAEVPPKLVVFIALTFSIVPSGFPNLIPSPSFWSAPTVLWRLLRNFVTHTNYEIQKNQHRTNVSDGIKRSVEKKRKEKKGHEHTHPTNFLAHRRRCQDEEDG